MKKIAKIIPVLMMSMFASGVVANNAEAIVPGGGGGGSSIVGGGGSSFSYSSNTRPNSSSAVSGGTVVINGITGTTTNTSGSTISSGSFSCPSCTQINNFDTMKIDSDGFVTLTDSSKMGTGEYNTVLIGGGAPSGGSSSSSPSTPTVTYSTVTFSSNSTISVGGVNVANNATQQVEVGKEYKVDFSHRISPTGYQNNAKYISYVTSVNDRAVETGEITSGTTYDGRTTIKIDELGQSQKVCQTVSYSPSSIKINNSTGAESISSSSTKTSMACVTLKTPVPEKAAGTDFSVTMGQFKGVNKVVRTNRDVLDMHQMVADVTDDIDGTIMSDMGFRHTVDEAVGSQNVGSFYNSANGQYDLSDPVWTNFTSFETFIDGRLVDTTSAKKAANAETDYTGLSCCGYWGTCRDFKTVFSSDSMIFQYGGKNTATINLPVLKSINDGEHEVCQRAHWEYVHYYSGVMRRGYSDACMKFNVVIKIDHFTPESTVE